MPQRSTSHVVTGLLARWREGDRAAFAELLPLVYDELRRLARRHLRGERPGHTLQPTALVHEAYLRLAGQPRRQWNNRVHFFAVAASVMRQVLVDHARARAAEKRGGDLVRIPLDAADGEAATAATDLLALDEALGRLARLDPRKARIVELRFFAGLSLEETAEVVGVAVPTVVRETRLARAWLIAALDADAAATGDRPTGGERAT